MRSYGVIVFFAVLVYSTCDVPNGYIINESDGRAYKLMYVAQKWNQARETCANEGAKLAVPKSEDEFKFIQRIVRGMHYPSIVGTNYKLLVWLGINNLENYRTWKNVDGENIEDTGFHTWAGRNGGTSDSPTEPHCVGMDAANFGLRDYWCHHRQPYICEKQNHV